MKRIIRYQAWNTKSGKISALLFALLLVMALTFGGCAIAGATQPTTQVPTPVTNGTATAAFQISGLLIYPERGYPGQEVVITTAVTNTGGSAGEYIAKLEINNTVEEQKTVTLPAKEMQVLNFLTSKFVPGTYYVSLGGLTGQFEVLDQPAGTAPPTTSSGGGTTNSPTPKVQVPKRGGCCGGG